LSGNLIYLDDIAFKSHIV